MLLPSVTFLALYFIDKMSARLGPIIGFSAMYSLALALFTNAKVIEISTATVSCVTTYCAFPSISDWVAVLQLYKLFSLGEQI